MGQRGRLLFFVIPHQKRTISLQVCYIKSSFECSLNTVEHLSYREETFIVRFLFNFKPKSLNLMYYSMPVYYSMEQTVYPLMEKRRKSWNMVISNFLNFTRIMSWDVLEIVQKRSLGEGGLSCINDTCTNLLYLVKTKYQYFQSSIREVSHVEPWTLKKLTTDSRHRMQVCQVLTIHNYILTTLTVHSYLSKLAHIRRLTTTEY